MQLPDHQQVCQALWAANINLSPAQIHGMTTAMVCTRHLDKDGQLLADAIIAFKGGQSDKLVHHRQVFTELSQATECAMKAAAFDFQLLLPDDEEDLVERVQEIGLWCKGFISGLTFIGTDDQDKNLSPECQDIISRFEEIAQVDALGIVHDEDEEVAYMELCEYVRMAAVMFYEEWLLSVAGTVREDSK